MNARFAQVLSRLSIVSVVAVSAFGAAACNNRAPATTGEAVQAEAAPAPSSCGEHRPGARIFREVQALDLREDQRAAVGEIEQNLLADLSPHREAVRQVVHLLASGLESGELDAREAATQQAALSAAILDVKTAIAGAMNSLHDVLDAGQRQALISKLEEQHRRGVVRGRDGAEHPDGPMAKLAFELGLTEDQKAALRDAVQEHVDAVFPDRKARREASEARMKALADAFVRDDFDAADHDLAPDASRSLEAFVETVGRTIDVSGRILTSPQRLALASILRGRAEKL